MNAKTPSSSIPTMGPVLDFLRLLWAVDHGLQKRSKAMVGTLGITGPQRLVIRLVGRFPGASAGDLAGLLKLHPSTLTGILKRLEARKLLARTEDPQDGRRALFSLTTAGKALDVERAGTVESAVAKALASLPPAKLKAGREVLTAFAQMLDPQEPPKVAGSARQRGARGSRRKSARTGGERAALSALAGR